ncbi:MAG: hypothetical protein WC655_08415, partial [Candidatus Hydrogenedentales bacterium]
MHRHFALVMAVGLSALAFGSELAGNEDYVVRRDCEQDADGVVWGMLSKPKSSTCFLGRWEDGKWTIADTSDWPKQFAVYDLGSLQRIESGDVLAYWGRGFDRDTILSVHRGETSKALTRLKVLTTRPHFSLDGTGNLWMKDLQSVYVAPLNPDMTEFSNRAIVSFYKHKYEYLWTLGWPPKEGDEDPRIVLDAKGRAWVWGRFDLMKPSRTLRGFYIIDTDESVTHPSVENIPDGTYTCFEPKDKDTFWLAVMEQGLYEIDVNQLKGKLIPAPETGALSYIYGIHSLNADTYIYASDEYDAEATMNLWQLRNGTWKKLLSDLDPTAQCLSKSSKGLWVGTRREGLWFVPARGEPERIDWRHGLPFTSVYRLFT